MSHSTHHLHMKNPIELRIHKLTLCLNEKELARVRQKFSGTTCRNLSEYIRKAVLAKPVTFNQRNASLDEAMQELTRLRTQLLDIHSDWEKSFERLASTADQGQLPMWLAQHEIDRRKFLAHLQEIKSHITRAAQLWLPS